jgi:hypothetical protein
LDVNVQGVLMKIQNLSLIGACLPYDRLNVTTIRQVALGDRWDGTVRIDADKITITTTSGIPAGQDRKPTTRTIEAKRP